MKTEATLTRETKWHENGKFVTRPAGTECFRVTGDLAEYEDESGMGRYIESRTRKANTVAILLDGKLRHVWRELVK